MTRQHVPAHEKPPRKIVVATVMASLDGPPIRRSSTIVQLISDACTAAHEQYGSPRLDLFILPEYALIREDGADAAERALPIDDPAVAAVTAAAHKAGTYVVLPLVLHDSSGYANAALLIDRCGRIAGVYRKAHPIQEIDGSFEHGVTPGRAYPVFSTDFGELGCQICWDMSHEDGWRALAMAGAEIVALPSASPQTVRPSAYAQQFRYWVVSSTPRDNVTIYDPIGLPAARLEKPGVLLHRFDLSSAVVHWSTRIDEGRAFARAFPGKGGVRWSTREDTGLFWSDDPEMTVGTMLRQLGVETMDEQTTRIAMALDRQWHKNGSSIIHGPST